MLHDANREWTEISDSIVGLISDRIHDPERLSLIRQMLKTMALAANMGSALAAYVCREKGIDIDSLLDEPEDCGSDRCMSIDDPCAACRGAKHQ